MEREAENSGHSSPIHGQQAGGSPPGGGRMAAVHPSLSLGRAAQENASDLLSLLRDSDGAGGPSVPDPMTVNPFIAAARRDLPAVISEPALEQHDRTPNAATSSAHADGSTSAAQMQPHQEARLNMPAVNPEPTLEQPNRNAAAAAALHTSNEAVAATQRQMSQEERRELIASLWSEMPFANRSAAAAGFGDSVAAATQRRVSGAEQQLPDDGSDVTTSAAAVGGSAPPPEWQPGVSGPEFGSAVDTLRSLATGSAVPPQQGISDSHRSFPGSFPVLLHHTDGALFLPCMKLSVGQC